MLTFWEPPEDWTPPEPLHKHMGAIVTTPGVLVGRTIKGWKRDGDHVEYLLLDNEDRLYLDVYDPFVACRFRLQRAK